MLYDAIYKKFPVHRTEREEQGVIVNGPDIPFWDGESIRKLGSGDGCTIPWIHKKTLNCILWKNEFNGMWVTTQ